MLTTPSARRSGFDFGPLPHRRWLACLAVLLLHTAGPAPLVAAVLYVSATQTTNTPADGLSWATAIPEVQASIDAAAEGDQIWVAAANYRGGITLKSGVAIYGGFLGDETELEQRDWRNRPTALDGGQVMRVVLVPIGTTLDTALDGLTIQNGNSWQHGGGIYCSQAALSARNLLVVNNVASADGGGIYCSSSTMLIDGCTISTNIAKSNSGSGGGGVWCGDSQVLITNSVIVGNGASAVAMTRLGGGVYCVGSTPSPPDPDRVRVTITGCVISGNSATGGGGIECDRFSVVRIENNLIAYNTVENGLGGGIECYASSPEIRRNRFVGNLVSKSSIGGGAIGVFALSGSQAAPLITDNVILGNGADSPGAGGGVFCQNGTSPVVQNNTIAGNFATVAAGIACLSSNALVVNNILAHHPKSNQLQPGVARNNCFFDSPDAADYAGGDAFGNFQADPGFEASLPYGDVRLPAHSPCRNAGSSTPTLSTLDFEGEPRVADGTVDVGSDEVTDNAQPFAPGVVYLAEDGDDRNNGTSWTTPLRSVQAAIDRACTSASEVWIRNGFYPVRNVQIRPFTHLYGGFDGTETNRSERDSQAQQPVLDAGGATAVLTARNAAYWLTVDGLTLQHGSSPLGGGLTLQNSAGLVANNRILDSTGHLGGGIYVAGGLIGTNAGPLITQNVVARNQSPKGGGITADSAHARVVNNLILSNAYHLLGGRGSFGSAGGVFLNTARGVVSGNVIAHNVNTNATDPDAASGIYCYRSPDASVLNNTLLHNSSASPGSAAARFNSSSLAPFANNLVVSNSAALSVTGTAPLLRHNNFFANGETPFLGVPNIIGFAGNIDTDPLLGDPDGFHLQLSSPCINAGTNGLMPSTFADLDGHARRHGTAVDIGADEVPLGSAWHPVLCPPPEMARYSATNVGGITYSLLEIVLPDSCHEIVYLGPFVSAPSCIETSVKIMQSDDPACLQVSSTNRWARVLGPQTPGLRPVRLLSWDSAVVCSSSLVVPPPGERTLTQAALDPSGEHHFNVQGVDYADYIVESSPDLATWSQILTNRGAPFTFIAPTNPTTEPTFYRTLVQPAP